MKTVRLTLLSAILVGIGLFGQAQAQSRSHEEAAEKARKRENRQKLLSESDDLTRRSRAKQGEESRALRRQAVIKRIMAEILSEDVTASAVFAQIREVLDDPTESPATKSELERLRAMLARKGRKFASKTEWMAERENVALDLMKRYPEAPAGYEEMLHVARLGSRERATAHAQVLLSGLAPESVKSRAREIVQRNTMDGQALASILGDTPDGGKIMRRGAGKMIVFYSWSPTDEVSISTIKQAASGIPSGALVLGVNVSPDAFAALERAQKEALPGEQLYGARGADSPIVRRLALTQTGLLYAVSRDGVLHNLTDAENAAAALEKLN